MENNSALLYKYTTNHPFRKSKSPDRKRDISTILYLCAAHSESCFCMASIFLSPSVQEYNKYLTGGDEEQYMNLIADAMMPYLEASGIYVTRNDPDEPLSAAIAASNAGVYDLHLALHSNASPESLSGQLQGPDVYYYRDSIRGQEAATVFANNLKWLYPIPDLVTIIPNTTLAELRRVTAPAVLLELAYHDNYFDVEWLKNNIDAIAYNLSVSVADFLGVEFVTP